MTQRYLLLALALIAFAATLAISSWRAVRSVSDRDPAVETPRVISPEIPKKVAPGVASVSSGRLAPIRAQALMEPLSKAVTQKEIAISTSDSTDGAIASTEADELELAARENPTVPHGARTR
jgi:hypothetical protein